jgi:glutamate 5-kinase
MKAKKVLVIKLGTAILTNSKGEIDNKVISNITAEIKSLSEKYNIVLVSSGAVGSGKKYLKNYKATIIERKAAAAVGNPLLMKMYQQYFIKREITVAQVLCERRHFSDRSTFLSLKETFVEFWKNDILPIVNENDLVSSYEIKFADNDELATLIAVGFDAEALLLCTSAGGFRDTENKIIPLVEKIDKQILSMVRLDKSSVGLGGMVSKLTYTKLALSLGIKVIICGLDIEKPFYSALAGKNGTQFIAKNVNINARNKWLASSSITIGELVIDKGAADAIHKRHSLLLVGVKELKGKFATNEVVKILNEDNELLAVAKTKASSTELQKQSDKKHIVVAHTDDIVILN